MNLGQIIRIVWLALVLCLLACEENQSQSAEDYCEHHCGVRELCPDVYGCYDYCIGQLEFDNKDELECELECLLDLGCVDNIFAACSQCYADFGL